MTDFTGNVPSFSSVQSETLKIMLFAKNCLDLDNIDSLCSLFALDKLVFDGAKDGCDTATDASDTAGLIFASTQINGKIPELSAATLPPCLLSMPQLSTLHAAGNKLKGSLQPVVNASSVVDSTGAPVKLGVGNVGMYLNDVRLDSNLFSGSLMRGFVRDSTQVFDVSNNR